MHWHHSAWDRKSTIWIAKGSQLNSKPCTLSLVRPTDRSSVHCSLTMSSLGDEGAAACLGASASLPQVTSAWLVSNAYGLSSSPPRGARILAPRWRTRMRQTPHSQTPWPVGQLHDSTMPMLACIQSESVRRGGQQRRAGACFTPRRVWEVGSLTAGGKGAACDASA